MDELLQLKTSILKEAEEKGQAYYQASLEKIKTDHQQKIEETEKYIEELRNKELNKVKQKHERLMQQIANKERQTSLVSKQQMLDTLFASAVEKMEAWTGQEEFDFFIQIMNRYQDQAIEVVFGDKTKAKLTDNDFAAMTNKFPKLTISPNTIPYKGGFILSRDRIDYNYTYESLVEDTHKYVGTEIANEVFTKQAAL